MALENRCGTEKRRVFTGVGPITLDLAKGCAKVFRRLRKKNLLMTKSTFYRHIFCGICGTVDRRTLQHRWRPRPSPLLSGS
ncbi:hypothetical protein, partial [Pseudomonas aeruginosa]|uniref:hypothetical protein n=6 Tax=Pseudomonas TaxID=286 RepID=UPI002230F7FD